MGFLGNITRGITDNWTKSRLPIGPGDGTDLNAHEAFYHDKRLAYGITLEVVKKAREKYEKELAIVTNKIVLIADLQNYVKSKKDDPPDTSKIIKDCEFKMKTIQHTVISFTKPSSTASKEIKSVDLLSGVVKSAQIIGDHALAHSIITIMARNVTDKVSVIAAKPNEPFDYLPWKKGFLSDTSKVLSNLRLARLHLQNNIGYIQRIISAW